MLQCEFCNKECKNANSLRNHERLCKENPNKQRSQFEIYNETRIGSWNSGLTKDSDERVLQHSLKLKGRSRAGFISKDGREKLSALAKERGLGGYKPHPNRGTYYKEIWFDSNWEIQVAKSLDENNIKWERPKIGFIWNDNGNRYYPDFYLPEYDVYLDPKNDYLISKDTLKINNAQRINNIKVFILTQSQLNWDSIKALIV